ncbi:g745 [Coccomyxa viridis]|uniref:G745 protein n=1 Tax=Coccomyxa viridis TaxID=1274662 RepID=A0ABP1FGG3_9CHLO
MPELGRRILSALTAATLALAILFSSTPIADAAAFPFAPRLSTAPATLEMKAPEPDKSELSPEELQTVELFLRNTPSVVNIANIASRTDFYTMDTMQVPQGTGSGFIWDMKGHVVTNFHVIRGASDIKVALIDSSVYPAKVIGGDPDKDIAVLQLQAPEEKLAELKPISIGTSTNLQVGQKVYAIGNPFGLDHTLTQGIVSGLGRELATPGFRGVPIKNVIQTDAAINPGNSGGVLLDSKGRLIGINTAIADPTGKGASSGVGFAIPIDTAKGLVEQVLKYGKVVRPILGITIAPPQTVRQIGVEGILVLEVPEGGPAARAGINGTYRDERGRVILGDVITAIDGKEIKLQRDLFQILDEKRPGDKIKLEVLRNGEKMAFDIELGGRQLSGTE